MYNTFVYVDAFNLFYGSLRHTDYRWLNLHRLCELLLTKNNIIKIKYFTACVSGRPNDPDKPLRQQTYLRALSTLKDTELYFGHYLTNNCFAPLAKPKPTGPKYVEIIKTEEKGSDVNLASHLLLDAFDNLYEVAVIISNDSDLLFPIHTVRDRFKRKIGILNPHKKPSLALMKEADFFKPIRPNVLRLSQFPDVLQDSRGQFHKPSSW